MARREQNNSILLLVAVIFFFTWLPALMSQAGPPAAPPAAPAAPPAVVVGQKGSYKLAPGTSTAYNGYELHRPPAGPANSHSYVGTSTPHRLAPQGSAPAVRPAAPAAHPAQPSEPATSDGPGLIIGIIVVGGIVFLVLCRRPSPIEFEARCAKQLRDTGWDARLTKASGDQGVDIIAEKDGLRVALQCKLYTNPVGNKAVQEIFTGGRHVRAHRCAVVTNSTYTASAKQVASTTGVLLLRDTDLTHLEKILREAGGCRPL
jgi:hypothetical protein